MPADPFSLDRARPDGLLGLAAGAVFPAAAWALGLGTCRSIYAHLQPPAAKPFEERVLAALNVTPFCTRADLAAIPSSGQLVVAANHPHGALDGLLLASVIRRVRPDVRILTNHLLARIPELSELCFLADPFGGAPANRRSLAACVRRTGWSPMVER
jgi:hypothetical protein